MALPRGLGSFSVIKRKGEREREFSISGKRLREIQSLRNGVHGGWPSYFWQDVGWRRRPIEERYDTDITAKSFTYRELETSGWSTG